MAISTSNRPASTPWLCAMAVLAAAWCRGHADEPRPTPQFERDVFPILTAHCFKCHGFEARKAGLDLRTVALMLRGGEHGPALVSGSREQSLLFQKIAARAMPPEGEKKLSDAQIETIGAWIAAGAPSAGADGPIMPAETPPVRDEHRQFWAFKKLQRQEPPQPRATASVRTPVDAFALAKLEEHDLTFSPDADASTLVRRAYFDLVGLPPPPDAVNAFLSDASSDAYERLLDRLLASPHFGERWGRHWLDVAGYSDTFGSDNDAGITRVAEGKWHYRDYVVRSFNSDKPFDRFVTEQIAGDELADWRSAERWTPQMRELLVAGGFLRNAPDSTTEPELNTALLRYQVIHDTVQITASSLLGLTIQCARCHSHKYDPISQLDYYRLMAVFTPAYDPQNWQQPPDRALPDVSPREKAEIDRHNGEIDRQIAELNRQLAEVRRPVEAKLFDGKLAALPEPIRADTRQAIETPVDKRSEIQKYLAGKFEASLKVKPEEVTAALSEADKVTAQKLGEQIAARNGERRMFGRVQTLVDVGPPPPTYLLRRGNHETPGPEVAPGFLGVLSASDGESFDETSAPPGTATSETQSSGRRLALARTLTRPDSPAGALVARVVVNRVWYHLFGEGIVTTLENFGQTGARPTHPELLDWLAAEFVRGGCQMKSLIKLIMTSTVYRQASAIGNQPSTISDPLAIDPDDTWLWRQRLRRLEAEVIRDALLAVSGQLDGAIGGPPVPLENRPDGMVVVAEKGLPTPASKYRRSLYLLARRNYQPSLLAVFDQPVLATNCTRRERSAVALQSLTMLNDAFVLEQAEQFAQRVAAADDDSQQRRIERAFRIALSRPPTAAEVQWSATMLNHQAERFAKQGSPDMTPDTAALKAWASLCQMLLNTNEFLYLE